MFLRLNLMKTTILAALIGVGTLVQSVQASAAETDVLTVAGGCFWCVEADFESVDGVSEVISGYADGSSTGPRYDDAQGRFESVQIHYDPDQVSRADLISMFFRAIDPTDAGGQFCDRGSIYRTAVFVGNEEERQEAETIKNNAQRALGQEIVTSILTVDAFYTAKAYHQDYYKSDDIILTRFGPKSKAKAYKRYRKGCGRDARVKELWGSDAPFATH